MAKRMATTTAVMMLAILAALAVKANEPHHDTAAHSITPSTSRYFDEALGFQGIVMPYRPQLRPLLLSRQGVGSQDFPLPRFHTTQAAQASHDFAHSIITIRTTLPHGSSTSCVPREYLGVS